VLLAVKNMGGETSEAWRAILDDLVKRGLRRPEFLMVDGGTGLEQALAALWGDVPTQRCTVHKHRNLLAHAPQRLHDEVSADYNDMIYATSPAEIEERRRAFLRKWRLKCKAPRRDRPQMKVKDVGVAGRAPARHCAQSTVSLAAALCRGRAVGSGLRRGGGAGVRIPGPAEPGPRAAAAARQEDIGESCARRWIWHGQKNDCCARPPRLGTTRHEAGGRCARGGALQPGGPGGRCRTTPPARAPTPTEGRTSRTASSRIENDRSCQSARSLARRLQGEETRFALDSPLEEIGFELVVPWRAASRQGPTNCPAIIIAVDDRNYPQT
jgi:hypothetical protein